MTFASTRGSATTLNIYWQRFDESGNAVRLTDSPNMQQGPSVRWIEFLSDEDLTFIKRLVLASGSLKELAAGYNISYPTVRLRLDRLIAKIQVTDNQDVRTDFERQLRAHHVEGKIDADTLKSLLATYRQEFEGREKDAARSA